ncbi:acyltransferase [Curtobacterium sp. MCLR17_058]|uniref:acyltransferase family protein n=1 Tax=Curtobacterium sp. MCLR17_058 TaxID=2175635 RepID=UPI0021AC76A6|nr:acyltransferase [Curtobacterium sp. MCLR17_058]WIB43284.1 acyltransferase [Curtobacterium sp. MCLR17_058]
MIAFDRYRSARHFPQLDGLRAVSILLVLTIHSHVSQLRFLNGYTGVTIFFVLSGYLITTLLLREQDKYRRVSLKGFYIRRVFRILPLYYLVLAVNVVAVYAGLGQDPGDFAHRLVLFLTYLNEFASPGTFGHSWSLAIEEKFYLVWPLLAFTLPVVWKWRVAIAGALALTAAVSGLWGGYLSIYAPIIFGCLIALLLHNERGFALAGRATRPLPGILLGTLAIVVLLLSTADSHHQVWFGFAFAIALPVLMIGPAGAHGWLSWKPLVFMGRRAYATYLIHPLVGSGLDGVLPNTSELPWSVVHLILMAAVSIGVAHLLFILFENPATQFGKRLAASQRPVGSLLADPRS